MGNYIGTDMIGGIPVPNGGNGVRLMNNANNNIVGGNSAASRNVISGNKAWGITLNGAPNNNVLANYIGVDTMGIAPLPNVSGGVNIANGSDGCNVGGLPATSSIISHNTGDGVKVSGSVDCVISFNQIHNNTGTGVLVANRSAYRDQISMNSIYGNGALGIDLGGDGVTPNDGDNNNPAKPNRGYNFPVFSSAEFPLVGGYAYVTGTAPPNAVVEVYHTGATSDPSGHGQGMSYLTSVTSGADGAFYAVLTGLSNGDEISAIATSQSGDPAGANNTSEFSLNATVKNAAPTTFYFAEGYTGTGFQEYLCLGNPGPIPFDVGVTFLFPDGSTQTDDYNVPAFSRLTVDVNQEVGAGKDVSIKCEGPLPYIAERPMYFTYGPGWTGRARRRGGFRTLPGVVFRRGLYRSRFRRVHLCAQSRGRRRRPDLPLPDPERGDSGGGPYRPRPLAADLPGQPAPGRGLRDLPQAGVHPAGGRRAAHVLRLPGQPRYGKTLERRALRHGGYLPGQHILLRRGLHRGRLRRVHHHPEPQRLGDNRGSRIPVGPRTGRAGDGLLQGPRSRQEDGVRERA